MIEESELLPDGTRVHTADIVAASSDVVVYSVPHAIFYKYAAVGEVSKERNSRRTEFISRQTELKPVSRRIGAEMCACVALDNALITNVGRADAKIRPEQDFSCAE